jgi:TonB family protein
MPRDLFGSTDRRASVRSRRRILTILSIAAHAIVVTAILVIQLFAIGPLPLPRRPLLFEEIRLVHLEEVRLAAPPRRGSGRSSERMPANVPPTIEPRSITPETGLADSTASHGSIGALPGVEDGTGDIGLIGSVEVVRPPSVSHAESPVRLHSGIQAPRKIQDVTPVYPSMARTAHAQGIVVLDAVIDARGNVASVEVRQSNPLLDRAAIDAVRQWRYTPALLNGQAVPVIVTITVRFQLQ